MLQRMKRLAVFPISVIPNRAYLRNWAEGETFSPCSNPNAAASNKVSSARKSQKT
jgi:hypothetical protein